MCWAGCMLAGRNKSSKRELTQFLHRLRVSEPTPVVDEVWDYIAILAFFYKDNQNTLIVFINFSYIAISKTYSGTIT